MTDKSKSCTFMACVGWWTPTWTSPPFIACWAPRKQQGEAFQTQRISWVGSFPPVWTPYNQDTRCAVACWWHSFPNIKATKTALRVQFAISLKNSIYEAMMRNNYVRWGNGRAFSMNWHETDILACIETSILFIVPASRQEWSKDWFWPLTLRYL